ncbi:MAG: 5'/3'-nucleotidase SurE [Elusimicrobia bacterium RIFOXYD2_FULL_34_15]|nr:MAG: 5'/3'-nucleotidase SurE [Elusimicrobia bacterium RIFOXYD2_FULL_34_15]
MRILISNDDGLYGAGLKPLISVMKKMGDVVVVVPDLNKSASSHSITVNRPMQLMPKGKNVYTLSGTPSDCVRFGIMWVMKGNVDLVVSGINDGPNMGEDCIYSGTVAAAREGAILGFPSFAISLVYDGKNRFKYAAEYAYKIIKKMFKYKVPKHTFFNINIPDYKSIKGVILTKMGKRIYNDYIDEKIDKKGRKYYRILSKQVSGYPIKNTDIIAMDNKYISVTPLKIDQTDHAYLKKLKKFK